MTKESLVKMLHKRADACGSWVLLAKSLSISPQYLQDIKDGRRDPGAKLLTAIGFIRVVSYEKVK